MPEHQQQITHPHECRGCGRVVDARKLDEHEAECSNPSRLRQYRRNKSAAGKRSAHKRFHVGRGITKPDCPLCVRAAVAITENVRRLQAWAAKEGTRRNIAHALANECAKHDFYAEDWAFLWEITGDDTELRKLIVRLGKRIVVNDPMGNAPPTQTTSG